MAPARTIRGGAGRPLPQPLEWLLRDRTTRGITIAQTPDPPLWAFLAAVVVRVVADPSGGLRTALDVVGGDALAWWTVDETGRGVNPWRRILGACVLVLAVAGRLSR